MAETFNIFLIVMAVLAAGVYVALHFFEAGYGYLFNPKYGPPVPNKVGWVVMESPVFIAMCVLWLMSGRTWEAGPLALFVPLGCIPIKKDGLHCEWKPSARPFATPQGAKCFGCRRRGARFPAFVPGCRSPLVKTPAEAGVPGR